VSDADAEKRFPQGWRAPKPYLRLTPDPRGPVPRPSAEVDLESSG
jgi:hypothetical protein